MTTAASFFINESAGVVGAIVVQFYRKPPSSTNLHTIHQDSAQVFTLTDLRLLSAFKKSIYCIFRTHFGLGLLTCCCASTPCQRTVAYFLEPSAFRVRQNKSKDHTYLYEGNKREPSVMCDLRHQMDGFL